MLFFKKGFMEYVLFEVELEASLDDYYNHVQNAYHISGMPFIECL